MADMLTPQQQEAVDNRGGNLLVSAAAGSGKTKVLVDRVMKYIMDKNDPANVDDFLMITFTEAAAAELRGKIAAKLSEHIANDPSNVHLRHQMQRLYLAKISTVHSFCADLLREYAYLLDIPGDFHVGDENECRQLREISLQLTLEEAYEQIHENPAFQAFVDSQGAGRNDGFLEDVILSVYNNSKCYIDPNGWLQGCLANANVSSVDDASQTVWGKYLIEDLKSYLVEQIASMQKCCKVVEFVPEQEKALSVLQENVLFLEKLNSLHNWDSFVENKNFSFGTLTFKKKSIDEDTIVHIKAVRDNCKETLKAKLARFYDYSRQVVTDLQACAVAAQGLVDIVKKFDEQYSKQKSMRHLLDFNDLEQYTLVLLLGKNKKNVTSAAGDIAKRFRQIMVDEYQDTNEVQDKIFSVLSMNRDNLFMVGDVKQSIYQFRLADPSIFLRKYAEYVHAESAELKQGRKVLLSSNFRSGKAVLNAVNDVFELCMSPQVGGLYYGEEEALREGIPHIPIGEPEIELHGIVTKESTYEEEAAFVAERIASLLDGTHMVRQNDSLRPICPEDIVVLLRSPGTTGSYFEQALNARGIPCDCGGTDDLLTMPEVEVLHSLLQIISNPRQDIPLLTVLASPLFGFTADDLASIRAANKNCNIYESVCASEDVKCQIFVETLRSLRKKASVDSLTELISEIINTTKIDAIYSARDDGASAKKNILTFYHYASRYSGQNGRNLDSFLRHLQTLQAVGLSVESEKSSGCVTIMSVHKSKGLEFPVVFLSGLSKGFNRQDLAATVLCHRELGIGLSCVDTSTRVRYPALSKHAIAVRKSAENISEELRILYVAMTRAKDRLIMTYADKYLISTLNDIAAEFVYTSNVVMSSNVKNIGHWILQAALRRTEAGAFFAVAGNPGNASVRKDPWLITLQESIVSDETDVGVFADIPMEADYSVTEFKEILDFTYPHLAATISPSKHTATQKKGREKDQEASQEAEQPRSIHRLWRNAHQRIDANKGKEFGNAVHNVLRFIDFSHCDSLPNICAELDRLKAEGFIAGEQLDLIDPDMLLRFFDSELGKRLIVSSNVLKEFKFSILEDAESYDPQLAGEKILLQGVVDCALIEDDGITVVDFKTDNIDNGNLKQLLQKYSEQVLTYASALERIYQMPVKAKCLYFFKTNEFYWL